MLYTVSCAVRTSAWELWYMVCVCVCVCVCIAVRYMNIVVLSFSMHALLGPGYLMEYK